MNLPEARKDNLLTTQLEDEVVVYDPERKQAHSLNRTALAVWNHSDGQTSIADLQRRVSKDVGAPISEAAVWLALRKLERAHLLAENLASTEPITRRHILGQAGRFSAAAMLATPIVISASVPAAAVACSTCGTITPVGGVLTNCACAGAFATCSGNVPDLVSTCVDISAPSTTNCGLIGNPAVFVPCATGTVCVAFAGNGCAGVCKPGPCTPINSCTCP